MKKIILVILCLFLPPIAVVCNRGLEKDFFISLALTLFFFVPGIIHAFYSTIEIGRNKRHR
ncbi:YqaE/Pmp3 family membrane protein [Vibrio hepatarius]|uniref:YqaE/Pmp3 family membrane protein n=1 Tax=Vibrio hepatarius TaxID=171383 RepID=UPI001C080FB4|nr:YqaE/Pmp3 family membrane protein [Vibrio hepatarius]MBU2897799.1 YqaE/Pmp3 family membrane protein [Vibrio hepatarius]